MIAPVNKKPGQLDRVLMLCGRRETAAWFDLSTCIL